MVYLKQYVEGAGGPNHYPPDISDGVVWYSVNKVRAGLIVMVSSNGCCGDFSESFIDIYMTS
jgi:hypothetical protein